MSHRLVVHCKRDSYDVYIGRGSKWGNQFRIGPDGDRDEVIKKHKDSLTPEMIEQIKEELPGKILGCWCDPENCHGDTLAKIANGDDDE